MRIGKKKMMMMNSSLLIFNVTRVGVCGGCGIKCEFISGNNRVNNRGIIPEYSRIFPNNRVLFGSV